MNTNQTLNEIILKHLKEGKIITFESCDRHAEVVKVTLQKLSFASSVKIPSDANMFDAIAALNLRID